MMLLTSSWDTEHVDRTLHRLPERGDLASGLIAGMVQGIKGAAGFTLGLAKTSSMRSVVSSMTT